MDDQRRKPSSNIVISFLEPLICMAAIMGDAVGEEIEGKGGNKKVPLERVSIRCQGFREICIERFLRLP